MGMIVRSFVLGLVLCPVVALGACSSSDGSTGGGSGGSAGGDAAAGSGGSSATGGASSGGAAPDSGAGGSTSSGGASTSGGATASGGATSSGGTAATGGSAGAGGSTGGPGSALLEDILSVCVWTTGCLNTGASFGGAAPNTNVGSCVGSFLAQAEHALEDPWSEFIACVKASPATCTDFRACLTANGALCGPDGQWTNGHRCPDGTLSCDPACLAACTGPTDYTCAPDGKSVQRCDGGLLQTAPCGLAGGPTGTCATPGGTTLCTMGQVGTCSGGNGAACDGNTLVFCFGGTEARRDCALSGQTCEPPGRCVAATDCTYDSPGDSCSGNTLTTCLAGKVRTVDCAALGGTCGVANGAAAACVLPGN